jgi:hypothetical protein
MEKTFGKISADERRRALEGEQIDHHLTEYEASKEWSITNMHTFNELATPQTLYYLYLRRRDDELAEFYLFSTPHYRAPKDDNWKSDDYDPIAELNASVAEDLLKSELLRKDISETGAFTPAELATYEAYWDAVSVERTRINARLRKGEDIRKDRRFLEEFEKGRKEVCIQVVLKSKELGISIDIISTITKLTIDEISEILKQYETTK